MKENNVTNIKYKQLDKDKGVSLMIEDMERYILGEKGVGLSKHLGLTPGKVQKALDDQWDEEFEKLLKEHGEYIFWESRKRSAEKMQNQIKMSKISMEDIEKVMEQSLKEAELEVVKELVDKYM